LTTLIEKNYNKIGKEDYDSQLSWERGWRS